MFAFKNTFKFYEYRFVKLSACPTSSCIQPCLSDTVKQRDNQPKFRSFRGLDSQVTCCNWYRFYKSFMTANQLPWSKAGKQTTALARSSPPNKFKQTYRKMTSLCAPSESSSIVPFPNSSRNGKGATPLQNRRQVHSFPARLHCCLHIIPDLIVTYPGNALLQFRNFDPTRQMNRKLGWLWLNLETDSAVLQFSIDCNPEAGARKEWRK